MKHLDLGFSIADGSYPELKASEGSLLVRFVTSGGKVESFQFVSVAAYSWQEGEIALAPGEPWDGACELDQSAFLASHPSGSTMHSIGVPRHFRLRFYPWGCLDVLSNSFALA